MILEDSLKQLEVAVKGGGNLVTHRPVFSVDGSLVYVIQGPRVLTYVTSTGLLLSKYTTPGVVGIANIHVLDNTQVLIFTTTGVLLRLDSSLSKVVERRKVQLQVHGWAPITCFTNFLYPTNSGSFEHFLVVGYPEDAALPVLYSVNNDKRYSLTRLCWSVVPGKHSVAVGQQGRFVVAIQDTSLYCKDMNDPTQCKWHKAGTRNFTCVSVHPTQDWVCATGDDSGRVLIWNNVMTQTSPAKTVFHWHTLPVMDLAFAPEGSQMFSGGGECTLVKWDTGDTTNKRTLPRMGLPIRHLSVSQNGELVAVSHADNCVQLVDAYNKVVGCIKNFTQCYVPEDEADDVRSPVFRSGINVDPRNSCLVLNGRPGWLQCYSFKEDKHMYALDICQQNYITAERTRAIANADVTHVSFSKQGTWMAVAESRTERETATESKLKFWKYDTVKQVFSLNTSVDWPHECPVGSLQFQPIPEHDGLVAASSADSTFKIWGIMDEVTVHGKSEWWYCERTCTYKDLRSGPLSFSTDGSMVAVAFEHIVTLWDTTEDCDFKLSLCHQRLSEPVSSLHFGQNVSSHLVICCSRSNLIVWDVITSSLLWVAPVQVSSICVDPCSNLACAATTSCHLFLFNPTNPEPLAVHKSVSKSKIIASAFVPNHKQMESVGQKSTYVFLNSSQELCALLPKHCIDEDGDVLRVERDVLLTPFAQMVAQKTVKQKDPNSAWGNNSSAGYKAHSILRDIMDASPHSMPSVSYYCSQLLKAVSKPTIESEHLGQIEKLVSSKPKAKSAKQSTLDNISDLSISDPVESKQLTINLDDVMDLDNCWIDSVFSQE